MRGKSLCRRKTPSLLFWLVYLGLVLRGEGRTGPRVLASREEVLIAGRLGLDCLSGTVGLLLCFFGDSLLFGRGLLAGALELLQHREDVLPVGLRRDHLGVVEEGDLRLARAHLREQLLEPRLVGVEKAVALFLLDLAEDEILDEDEVLLELLSRQSIGEALVLFLGLETAVVVVERLDELLSAPTQLLLISRVRVLVRGELVVGDARTRLRLLVVADPRV